MHIDVERLCASQLLRSSAEHLQAAEEVASLVLNNYDVPDNQAWAAERLLGALTAARTGAIFVTEAKDGEALSGGWEELPPLPFPRCWFEVWDSDEASPLAIATHTDPSGQDLALIGYGIVEVEQCAEWHVYGVFVLSPGWTDIEILSWDLLTGEGLDGVRGPLGLYGPDPDPICIRVDKHMSRWVKGLDEEARGRLQLSLLTPAGIAQLIDVVGSVHEVVPLPRATRRRFERRYRGAHPAVYFVNLRTAGDPLEIGHGESHYRHRWLVRGHYRRQNNGRFSVPGKGTCTWVRPYVKGPVGAPWKGRPVYVREKAA